MKLSSISLIVAVLAAIAKAVPVDFQVTDRHKIREERHLDEARMCWDMSYCAEQLGLQDIAVSQAKLSAEQHTHRIGHKDAKEGRINYYPLSTIHSADKARDQREEHMKELVKVSLHREAVERHENSIGQCKEAVSELKRAGLPISYHRAAIKAHQGHRDGHKKSLKDGTNYPLDSTKVCDHTDRQAAKDIETAKRTLGYSTKRQ